MRELRGKRSQAQMASLLGMTQQHYCNIENGKRGINPKYFKTLEAVFNEKIEKLAPDIFINKKILNERRYKKGDTYEKTRKKQTE